MTNTTKLLPGTRVKYLARNGGFGTVAEGTPPDARFALVKFDGPPFGTYSVPVLDLDECRLQPLPARRPHLSEL